MLKIGQIVQGTIKEYNDQMAGVLYVQKDCVIVKQAMKQEQVKVKILKKSGNVYIGELIQILTKQKGRCEAPCGIYKRCGSCHLMHMPYEEQLKLKKQQMVDLVKKSKVSHIRVHDVVGMEEPYHYRNKMIIGFQKDKQRKIKAGFYEEFSHHIVPYQACLLHNEECDRIIQTIVSLMEKFRIEPYNEDHRTGLLRHVLIRYGEVSKQIMVVLVLNSQVFASRKNFVQELLKAHPSITTIVQNVNTRKTSVVLGDQERVLYGKGFIEDVLCGLKFRISPKSFYQINHAQTERLYEKGLSLLKLTGKERLLDAYCGIGTIGMAAASRVKEVIGVELNKDAVEDARRNAVANQIRNVKIICDDATEYMRKGKQHKFDVVMMDPPRSGSTEAFMDSVMRLNPKSVVYISCNPYTQVRDLEYFHKRGWIAKDMYLYDLFPQTNSVESVCLIVRK